MRDLATEPREAYNQLGTECGQAFIGLVGDFRSAVFAADVPGGPISAYRDGDHFEVEWFVFNGCKLRTVIVVSGSDDDAWKDAYRIHLKSLTLGKKVLE